MSDSVRPHRRQPTRLLCPWDSLGNNTGVGCHFLLPQSSWLPLKVRPHRLKPTRAHMHTRAHSPPRLAEGPARRPLGLKAGVLAKLLEKEQQLEAAQALQALRGQRLPLVLLSDSLPVVVVRGLRGAPGDVALVRLHRPPLLLLGGREQVLEARVPLGWESGCGGGAVAAPKGGRGRCSAKDPGPITYTRLQNPEGKVVPSIISVYQRDKENAQISV